MLDLERASNAQGSTAFDGELGEADEQGLADAPSAMLRVDEEVFEVDARLGEKSGVVVEEEREAGGLATPGGDEDLGVGAGPEERGGELGFVCGNGIEQLFVSGERPDEAEAASRGAEPRAADEARALLPRRYPTSMNSGTPRK